MIHSLLTFVLLVAPSGGGHETLQVGAIKTAAAPKLAKEKKPSLAENLNNGSYLKLTDGSVWNVRPQDTAISQGWITEVEITISSSGNPQYPSKLTNTLSRSSVLAKRTDAVPTSTPPPAPAPTPAPTPATKK